jgi:DNA-binding GntR family transcriptional regulator
MEQAYDELKRRIVTLEARPGERIDEYEMARELELSRTPVREALFQLLAERLVTFRHGSGFIVQPLELIDVVDFFEAHIVISKATARLAAINATPTDLKAMGKHAVKVRKAMERRDYLEITRANAAFHRCESEAAHSLHMEQIARSLIEQGQRLAYFCFGGTNDNWDGLEDHFASVLEQHDRLMAAYESGDQVAAEATATEHVGAFRRRVQLYLVTSSSVMDDISFPELADQEPLVKPGKPAVRR